MGHKHHNIWSNIYSNNLYDDDQDVDGHNHDDGINHIHGHGRTDDYNNKNHRRNFFNLYRNILPYLPHLEVWGTVLL